jgi:hypothetical protein
VRLSRYFARGQGELAARRWRSGARERSARRRARPSGADSRAPRSRPHRRRSGGRPRRRGETAAARALAACVRAGARDAASAPARTDGRAPRARRRPPRQDRRPPFPGVRRRDAATEPVRVRRGRSSFPRAAAVPSGPGQLVGVRALELRREGEEFLPRPAQAAPDLCRTSMSSSMTTSSVPGGTSVIEVAQSGRRDRRRQSESRTAARLLAALRRDCQTERRPIGPRASKPIARRARPRHWPSGEVPTARCGGLQRRTPSSVEWRETRPSIDARAPS